DPSVSLEITPGETELAPGDTAHFTAVLGGTPNQPVKWTVLEPGGGTIDATGSYTAPATEGDYTIVASYEEPLRTKSAKVKVRKSIRVSVTPLAATVAPGQSVKLAATVSGTGKKAVTWSVAE